MYELDDLLLSDFMSGFWGYGSVSADYWFIGMEEGGGNTFEEVERRIYQWDIRGRLQFEDIYGYHMSIDIPRWFQEGAPLQGTWNRLIRILLAAKGYEPDREMVRSYQISNLGRTNGETCLLELLPLPSPGIGRWHYNDYSNIPALASRKRYTQIIGNKRAAYLTQLISKHQPRFVVFYGISYLQRWREIAKVEFIEEKFFGKSVYFGKAGSTVLVISQHPIAHGVRLEYFHAIGRRLAVGV